MVQIGDAAMLSSSFPPDGRGDRNAPSAGRSTGRGYTRRVIRRLSPALLAAAFVLSAITPASGARAKLEPVAGDLAFPANFALSPDGRIFYVEKNTGDVRIIEDGNLLPDPFIHLDVVAGGETGLLGIALHPGFPDKPWVYLYYSDAADGRNRLIRVLADGDRAGDVQNLIDGLTTGNGYHNGGDIAFGLDGSLFLSLGEAHDAERAQDPNDIGGKVLRIETDGNLPTDNPFGPDNPAYSIGHRNSFGLCVDPSTGDLWETENGPTGDDEVNRIVAGENYGWPEQLGPGGAPNFVDPVVDYRDTIVPSGCAVWNGDLYVGSYATGLLHRISLPATPGQALDDVVADFRAPVTDVEAGSDGRLYVATTDAIYRVGGEAAPMSPIPVPSPISSPPPDDGDHATRLLLATAAAIAAGLGLALRFAAGRRLRRDLRRDADAPDAGAQDPESTDRGGGAD
jgi:glucose/arabinose dehydrogenase